MSESILSTLQNQVIMPGLCIGCGACVACSQRGEMRSTPTGPIPHFSADETLPASALEACPAYRLHYPPLYLAHYGRHPENWLTGIAQKVRTGYAADESIRRTGASGGVLTRVLMHLLQTGRVDAVIAARQGTPTPEEARAVVCRTPDEVLTCAQSVYIPVAMLDILRQLEPGKRYAITCLPEQSAALRKLQSQGHPGAQQIRYVVGPYTGTALYPAAIRAFLRSHGIGNDDAITRLQWRAGEWPGYLEIQLASGAVVRTKKVYYNFLIPFYVTQASLQSMDFANEFADLAVGDAWSPKHESLGGGHSIIVTRTTEMEAIVNEMVSQNLLIVQEEHPLKASEMHGHMLDFKKRGGYLRNRWRLRTGRPAPDYGYRPAAVPLSRKCVEVVISGIFAIGRTSLARWVVTHIPERIIGPMFDNLRKGWKSASKPTKRKGLSDFRVVITGERA